MIIFKTPNCFGITNWNQSVNHQSENHRLKLWWLINYQWKHQTLKAFIIVNTCYINGLYIQLYLQGKKTRVNRAHASVHVLLHNLLTKINMYSVNINILMSLWSSGGSIAEGDHTSHFSDWPPCGVCPPPPVQTVETPEMCTLLLVIGSLT